MPGAGGACGRAACRGFLLRRGGRTAIVDPGGNSVSRLVARGFDPFETPGVFALHVHDDHVGSPSLAVSVAIALGRADRIDGRSGVEPPLVDCANAHAARTGSTCPAFGWAATVVALFSAPRRGAGSGMPGVAATPSPRPGFPPTSACVPRTGGMAAPTSTPESSILRRAGSATRPAPGCRGTARGVAPAASTPGNSGRSRPETRPSYEGGVSALPDIEAVILDGRHGTRLAPTAIFDIHEIWRF
jgi:hypothetical protein